MFFMIEEEMTQMLSNAIARSTSASTGPNTSCSTCPVTSESESPLDSDGNQQNSDQEKRMSRLNPLKSPLNQTLFASNRRNIQHLTISFPNGNSFIKEWMIMLCEEQGKGAEPCSVGDIKNNGKWAKKTDLKKKAQLGCKVVFNFESSCLIAASAKGHPVRHLDKCSRESHWNKVECFCDDYDDCSLDVARWMSEEERIAKSGEGDNELVKFDQMNVERCLKEWKNVPEELKVTKKTREADSRKKEESSANGVTNPLLCFGILVFLLRKNFI